MKHMTKLELARAFLAINPNMTNAQLAAAINSTYGTAASYRCYINKEDCEAA